MSLRAHLWFVQPDERRKSGNHWGMQDSRISDSQPADSRAADSRAADGVEHLQRAAREMIKAARSFLDLVEEVVEDPDRISEAASSVAEMVRGGLSKQEQPWERSAYGEPEPEPDTETESEPEPDTEPEPEPDTEPEPAKTSQADIPTRQRTPPSSRVRRITVD